MREDSLNTSTELWNDSVHTFTGLLEGGAMDVGLGRNATYIQTGTPHFTLFYNDNLQPLFGSIFSGTVAARPRADDDYVSGGTADHSTIVHFAIVYRW